MSGPRAAMSLGWVLALAGITCTASSSLEHTYTVTGRMMLPRHGEFTTTMTVHLTDAWSDGSTRLRRMHVQDVRLIDKHGERHELPTDKALHRRSFFFEQAVRGHLSDCNVGCMFVALHGVLLALPPLFLSRTRFVLTRPHTLAISG